MKIHFICRGNSFRSFIAETLLRSKQIPGLEIYSSGTVAAEHKKQNTNSHSYIESELKERGFSDFLPQSWAQTTTQELLNYADITVVVNEIAYSELTSLLNPPKNTIVWDIDDYDEGYNKANKNRTLEGVVGLAIEKISVQVDKLAADLATIN